MWKLEREMKKNQVGVRAWHVSYKNEARASRWINNRRVGEYIAPLLSVIRRASRGNQSRIRVGSFPGRMSSLPACRTENRGRIKEADLQRCIEEESSRKASAWPDSRNDPCCEAKHLTDRHSWCDRHTPVRMQNVTGDPLAIPRRLPRPVEIRSSPSLREHGRSALVKIPNDSWRPEGSSLERAGVCDDSRSWKLFPSANYSRDYFCMSGYHSVLIHLRCLRSIEIEMESNANIKQLFAPKLSNFSYNHKENLFR